MAPADTILLSAIITAPSCNGEFLKNIFSIRRVLILALITSPVSIYSCRLFLRAITIRAPTFSFTILRQASANGVIDSCTEVPFFFSRTRSKNRMKYFQLFREPIREKNWRISFWKITIIAKAPTLNIPSKIAPSRSILNTRVTKNHVTTKVISPIKIFFAPVPRVHVYNKYIKMATSIISIASFI